MKCALLLKGQMRGYKQCIPHMFSNFININDIDIFISTEKNDKINNNLTKEEIIIDYKNKVKKIKFLEDINFLEYRNFLEKSINTFLMGDNIISLSDINNFEQFKIKYLLNQDKNDTYYLKKNSSGYQYSERELMIIIHLNETIKLLEEYIHETNTKYDYVFIYRPDLYITNKFDLNIFNLKINQILYRVDYMMIFNYKDIYKFKNIYNNYLNFLDSKNTKFIRDKKNSEIDFYFLVERNLSLFLTNNFEKVYFILNLLGNIRYDNNNKLNICDDYSNLNLFVDALKKNNLLK